MSTATAERPPGVGDVAPDFTADSTSGSPVALSSYRGTSRVLLAFFPLAFTSTCTAEMCEFRDDYEQYARVGVTLLPISVDSVPSLKEFKAKLATTVEFLSDFKRDISRAYGVLMPERFFANRAYFLIGTDGRVAWKFVEDSPGTKRSTAEILAAIDSKP